MRVGGDSGDLDLVFASHVEEVVSLLYLLKAYVLHGDSLVLDAESLLLLLNDGLDLSELMPLVEGLIDSVVVVVADGVLEYLLGSGGIHVCFPLQLSLIKDLVGSYLNASCMINPDNPSRVSLNDW